MARKRAALSVLWWCWPTFWKHAISDGVMLWNAGVALHSAIDLCRQSPWVFPPETRAQLCYLTARHLDLMVRCQVHPRVENCADRKHAQKRIVKPTDLLSGPSRVVTETDSLPIDHDRARETEDAR